MKLRLTLILLAIAAVCAPAVGQKAKGKQRLPLYFMLGQSNMIGATGGVWYLFPDSKDRQGKPVKHLFKQADLMIWSAARKGTGNTAKIESWSWEPYQAAWLEGKDGNANTELVDHQGKAGKNLSGPEAALGAELVELHGGKVYMIKIAMVSALGRFGSEAKHTFPQWNKGAGELYPKLRQYFRAAAKAVEPAILEPKAVFWMQGSTDTSTKKQRKEYAKNLLRFAKDLRKDLKYKKLPFVVGRLHNGYDDGKLASAAHWQPAIDLLRKAQVAAAKKDRYMTWIDTDGFTRGTNREPSDPVHFDEQGTIDFGRALFRAYVDNFGGKK